MEEALERWIAAGMYYMYPAEPLPPALLEGCKVREEGREEKGRKEVRKDPTHHHPAQSLLSTFPLDAEWSEIEVHKGGLPSGPI